MGASTKILFITFATLVFFHFLSGADSATLTITNECNFTVFPVILSAAVTSPLSTTGFPLQQGESTIIPLPPDWSGRLWGRTLCSYDITGKFFCTTGDCGSSTVECAGGNASPPVTMVELALNGTGGNDVSDVSLVYGFNLPVMVEPRGGNENCMATGCVMNLNVACPTELKVLREGEAVACKSECEAEPCLSSQFLKTTCPLAHVYSYDHASFTCAFADYIVTFCPTRWDKKYPGTVDNSVPGSHSPINVVALVIALASIFGAATGLYIVCQMKIPLPNGDCLCRIGVETRT